MARFAVRRLAGMAFVLFAISVITFLIFNVVPNSDPAVRMAGKAADAQLIENVREEWSFDKSLPEQYVTMMKKVFSGDLVSYDSHYNVDEKIAEGIPASFSLCIGATVLWLGFGVLFGYLSAIGAGGWLDRVLTVVAVVGISIPVVWLGTILLNFLSFKLELFPTNGYVGLSEEPIEWAHHLILPWVTLAAISVGFYSRVLRSSMLDVMSEDYVRSARAKGLSERQVMTRHVLRNSLIPIVSLLGLDFGATLAGGAILTEAIFGLEGVGEFAYEATTNLDLPPIMAITLFGAFLIVFFNALVDIAYAYLDPRVRLGESPE